MQLTINGGKPLLVQTAQELGDYLAKWGSKSGDFVILEDGEADYIQSAIDSKGFIVESRERATATMYRAVRAMAQPDQRRDRWSRDEALNLLQAYFPSRIRSGQAVWEDMHMHTSAGGVGIPNWVYWAAAVLVGAGAFIYQEIYK